MFVDHVFAKSALPPVPERLLYQYVVAANGVFVRAWRPGLSAMIPINAMESFYGDGIRGLVDVQPYVQLESQVPARLTRLIFQRALKEIDREILFYLSGGSRSLNQPWRVIVPVQTATATSVRAVNDAGVDTLIEIHSHNRMVAFFSSTDDREERTGFRIYAVIGNLAGNRPEIRVRVGIYGYFWTIPASVVFGQLNSVTDKGDAVNETGF